MQDTAGMTDKELIKQLEAFYSFVDVFGYGYFNEEALLYFNALRSEQAIRIDRQSK